MTFNVADWTRSELSAVRERSTQLAIVVAPPPLKVVFSIEYAGIGAKSFATESRDGYSSAARIASGRWDRMELEEPKFCWDLS